MDVSICALKPLLKDPIDDLKVNGIRDQCFPLLEEEEEVESRVAEAGLIRSGSGLTACIPKAKFGERDRRNDVVVRRDRSLDKATWPSGVYQPIVDVWATDSEEEHLILQHVQQRSNSKVRSILEACRRLLGSLGSAEISDMDASESMSKSLLGHQTSGRATRAALYAHEELINDGAPEGDKMNGYNSGLSEYFRKVKYGERDGKRNNEAVRGVRSLDLVNSAAEYRPIKHVRDSDSEEEDLIPQNVPKKSNAKVKSVVEACRRFLGFSL